MPGQKDEVRQKDEVLRQVVGLLSVLSRGEATPAVQPWLCGGSLAALHKKDGGLRPVAVGETWRRLTSKVLASIVVEDVREYLEPLQVGVGTKAGCESLVHVVRQWLGRNSSDANRVLAMLDLSNAFNCIDRSAFRAAARRVMPSAVPWIDFCYGIDSNLMLGSHLVQLRRGVQQGDPLGPAFFSIAIHEHIQKGKA